MVRAIIAGGTNYSYQSFDDLVEDLEDWIINLNETIKSFKETIEKLEQSGYWNTVPHNIRFFVRDSLKFFETSTLTPYVCANRSQIYGFLQTESNSIDHFVVRKAHYSELEKSSLDLAV